ncbi:MAG TPA: short-chain dehydrogenase [Lentisphaeria bacterium]|nr:MAG: short-chain dehydrogenase [Lentisphaerae bacterium GWF2_49_21]HBC88150.1 short-chain dehydrogenase [Lentisphaeria bacterium]
MKVKEYFNGKVCVVTGAASGIGFSLAEALLQAGAVVCMADRDAKMLQSSVARLSAHSGRIRSMVVDVTKQEQVRKMVEDTASSNGRLNVLFNNAGIPGSLPIGDATIEFWQRIIDINLWGVIYGINAALPIMRRQGSGHIVNTASMGGLLPLPYQVPYCTTKGAVISLSESLRYELRDEKINVSVACPGYVVSRIYGSGKIPEDAIPAEEAVRIILEGVADLEGIIALPEPSRKLWGEYRRNPEAFDIWVRDLARQRLANLKSRGSIE